MNTPWIKSPACFLISTSPTQMSQELILLILITCCTVAIVYIYFFKNLMKASAILTDI